MKISSNMEKLDQFLVHVVYVAGQSPEACFPLNPGNTGILIVFS